MLAVILMLGEVFYRQGELEQAKLVNQHILVEAVGNESIRMIKEMR